MDVGRPPWGEHQATHGARNPRQAAQGSCSRLGDTTTTEEQRPVFCDAPDEWPLSSGQVGTRHIEHSEIISKSVGILLCRFINFTQESCCFQGGLNGGEFNRHADIACPQRQAMLPETLQNALQTCWCTKLRIACQLTVYIPSCLGSNELDSIVAVFGKPLSQIRQPRLE